MNRNKFTLLFPYIILILISMSFYQFFFQGVKYLESLEKELDEFYEQHELEEENIMESRVLSDKDEGMLIYITNKDNLKEYVLNYQNKTLQDITKELRETQDKLIKTVNYDEKLYKSLYHTFNSEIMFTHNPRLNMIIQGLDLQNEKIEATFVDLIIDNENRKYLSEDNLILKVNNKVLINTPNNLSKIKDYKSILDIDNHTNRDVLALFTYQGKDYFIYAETKEDNYLSLFSDIKYAVFENNKLKGNAQNVDKELKNIIKKYTE